jgi:CRP-like cAMP-binding protein
MNETTLESLRHVHIFGALDDTELVRIAQLCKVWRIPENHVVFQEGDEGDQLYIIQEGRVRVALTTRSIDGYVTQGTINVLQTGQSFGELVLLYGPTRSATVTSIDPTTLLVLNQHDFAKLSEANPRIGYRVMRQMASDLAYKLRSSNLLLRGNIRWQHDELGYRSR